MVYNYDKLCKLLSDKHMTKTDMRKNAGLSTNTLAKMGKGESISMDSLAKIVSALGCRFDDIVDIESMNLEGK